jgi:hypothetical protein
MEGGDEGTTVKGETRMRCKTKKISGKRNRRRWQGGGDIKKTALHL